MTLPPAKNNPFSDARQPQSAIKLQAASKKSKLDQNITEHVTGAVGTAHTEGDGEPRGEGREGDDLRKTCMSGEDEFLRTTVRASEGRPRRRS